MKVVYYIATVLAILLAGYNAMPTANKEDKDPSESAEKDIMTYYSELLTQLIQVFPSVDNSKLYEAYQKRMFGGHLGKRSMSQQDGGTRKQFESLAAELQAEMDRRMIVEPRTPDKKHVEEPSSEENGEEKEVEYLQHKLADIELKLKEANERTTSTTTTMADNDKQTDYQQIKAQLEQTEGKLSEILKKLQARIEDTEPTTTAEPSDHEEDESSNLKDLSKLLAMNTNEAPSASHQEVHVDNSQIAENDKLNQLAYIVKNLVEVNQLSYLQLRNDIENMKQQLNSKTQP